MKEDKVLRLMELANGNLFYVVKNLSLLFQRPDCPGKFHKNRTLNFLMNLHQKLEDEMKLREDNNAKERF